MGWLSFEVGLGAEGLGDLHHGLLVDVGHQGAWMATAVAGDEDLGDRPPRAVEGVKPTS
jgi:hypothetical protein